MEELLTRICQTEGWERTDSGVNVPLPDGRHQEVFTDPKAGPRWLVYSIIGREEILDVERLRAALGLNWSLARGALALHEGELVLRDTLPTKSDAAELTSSIRAISVTADRYERLLYGGDSH